MINKDKKQSNVGVGEGPPLFVLLVLASILLLLVIFLVMTILKNNQYRDNNKQTEVPEVVSRFLSAITEPSADIESVLNTYVVTTVIENDTLGTVGNLIDILSFEYILTMSEGQPHGYVVKDSTDGYLEFCILDIEGEETYPRVAFSYSLVEDESKIADYSLARLQPFSRRNEEYDERWSR